MSDVGCWLLFDVCCFYCFVSSLSVVIFCCVLCVVCCVLFVVCVVRVVCCVLFLFCVWCLLLVVPCVLSVVCLSLCVVCCLFVGDRLLLGARLFVNVASCVLFVCCDV